MDDVVSIMAVNTVGVRGSEDNILAVGADDMLNAFQVIRFFRQLQWNRKFVPDRAVTCLQLRKPFADLITDIDPVPAIP